MLGRERSVYNAHQDFLRILSRHVVARFWERKRKHNLTTVLFGYTLVDLRLGIQITVLSSSPELSIVRYGRVD
jgi:hypothetical protein